MKRRVDAAVFDVDGMLLDTREFIYRAYEHTTAEYGLPIPPREEIAMHIGKSLTDCYVALAGVAYQQELEATHHNYQQNQLHIITAYEGLYEMLDQARSAGISLAAYSSRKGNLIPSLENAGVADYFETIVEGSDVKKSKPHPEGVHMALKRIGVPPNRAAMLGDAVVDIEAGKAAKVAMTIGITHGFGTRQDLESARPTHLVDDLPSITPLLVDG